MTSEQIQETLTSLKERLMSMPEPNNRDFVIHTGIRGARAFSRALELNTLHIALERLIQEDKITMKELVSLHAILDSSDDRDFELAKTIIDTKL
jgi:hypothetical protein